MMIYCMYIKCTRNKYQLLAFTHNIKFSFLSCPEIRVVDTSTQFFSFHFMSSSIMYYQININNLFLAYTEATTSRAYFLIYYHLNNHCLQKKSFPLLNTY